MSMNVCVFTGNLTRDPELKYLTSGTAVTNFGLAVNRVYKDKSGNKKEEVSFIELESWGRQGEVIAEFCKKGSHLSVVSRVKQDRWEQDGQKRSVLRFVVDSFEFGSKGGGGTPTESRKADTDVLKDTGEDDIPF